MICEACEDPILPGEATATISDGIAGLMTVHADCADDDD